VVLTPGKSLPSGVVYLFRAMLVRPLKRRTNILILMHLLELMIQEPRGPTRLAQAANLNYQRCEGFLSLLLARGLVERGIREGRDAFSATQKGREVFMSWAKIYEELDLS